VILKKYNQSRRRPEMQPAVVIQLAGRWLANWMGDFGDVGSSRLQSEREARLTG